MEAHKDHISKLNDDIQLLKVANETDPEKEDLRKQVIDLQSDSDTKHKLREENLALFEKVQTLNAKINMVVTENHNLKEG